MSRGKFISIEGIEGAGKSTAIHFIQDYLTQAKLDVVLTREPGGTFLAEEIRAIILRPNNQEELTPEAELLLMFAGRAQHVQKRIKPELQTGKWVIADRFIDASYAYQGGGRQLAEKYIAILDQWIVADIYPDLTLLLDVSPNLGFERAKKRGLEKDRIEQEKIAFFERVRATYLARAKQDPKRIKLIDATTTLIAVENQIRDVLDEFISRK